MKKLLSAVFALALGITCTASLAGCNSCGSDDDGVDYQAVVDSAIDQVTMMHGTAADKETTSSFKVLAKTQYDGTPCTITWTVSSEVATYMSVGTELDADNKITISVTRPTTDINYTLTATANAGGKSAKHDFARILKGQSQSDILTVAQVYALDLTKVVEIKSGNYTNKYYSEDKTTAAVVTVQGYVTDAGSWNTANNNLNNVYIGDTATATTTLQIYRIKPDDVHIKADGDLKKGDFVTFTGCVQIYNNKPEISYCGSTNVTCVGLDRPQTSDADKVAAVKSALSLNPFYGAGDVTLPATQDDATLTWKVKSGSSVAINGTTMTVSEPSADTDVTLESTITVGNAKDTKDVVIKVLKTSAAQTGTFTLSVVQGNVNNKKLYFIGTINGSGFGETSTDATKAAEVVIAETTGGYTLKVGEKYLELNSNHRMTFVDSSTGAWVYYAGIGGGVFTWKVTSENEVYYLGTYGTFETMSASKISYLAGDTNFVASFEAVAADTRTPAEKVAAALAAFTVPSEVTGNINVTSSVKGVTITLASDNTAVIAANGTVTRPEADAGDATVELTITATCDGVSDSKKVTVTVKAKAATVAGESVLSLTKEVASKWGSGTSYAAYDGAHVVGDYTVNTANILANTYNGYNVLQFRAKTTDTTKPEGVMTVDGEFSKIVIVFVSTYAFDKANPLAVKAGDTTLTCTLIDTKDTGVMAGNYEIHLYTIEFIVTGSGSQTITLTKDTTGAGYITSIDFYA